VEKITSKEKSKTTVNNENGDIESNTRKKTQKKLTTKNTNNKNNQKSIKKIQFSEKREVKTIIETINTPKEIGIVSPQSKSILKNLTTDLPHPNYD